VQVGDALSLRQTYQGGWQDQATGLINFQMRDYNPRTQTWISQDPLGYVDGMNAYLFVRGNPLNLKDPFGLEAVGHHIVPQELWKDLPDTPGKQLWDRLSTGKLPGGHHWDAPHAEYNEAVKEMFCKWKEGKNVSKLSAEEAMDFYKLVLNSKNEHIAGYLGTIKKQLGKTLETIVEVSAKEAIEAQAVRKGARLTAQQFVKSGLKKVKVPVIMAIFVIIDLKERGPAYAARNAIVPVDDINDGLHAIAGTVSDWVDGANQWNMNKRFDNADISPEDIGLDPGDLERGGGIPYDPSK